MLPAVCALPHRGAQSASVHTVPPCGVLNPPVCDDPGDSRTWETPRERTRQKAGGGQPVRLCLIWQTVGKHRRRLGLAGGCLPSGTLLPEPWPATLFRLADFKRDWGIPGRQKNSGPQVGSLSKITHVFISGRRAAATRAAVLVSPVMGATGAERGRQEPEEGRVALAGEEGIGLVASEWKICCSGEAGAPSFPASGHCRLL